eukprot:scaffold21003_cov59-Attheya_sp.AAC.2
MMNNSFKIHVERSVSLESLDQGSQHAPVSQGKRIDDGQFDDAPPNDEHTNALKAGPISSGQSPPCKPSLNNEVVTRTPTNQTPKSDLKKGEFRSVSPLNDAIRTGQDTNIVLEEQVSPTDVLCGRGGGTNNHAGNKYFRILVSRYRPDYVIAKKAQKSQIARRIVEEIRSRAAENPCGGRGGRFLKRNIGSNTWYDIGNKRATEKTSQALREGLANKMRQAMMATGVSSFSQYPNESYEMNSPPDSVVVYHQYQYYHAMKRRRLGA